MNDKIDRTTEFEVVRPPHPEATDTGASQEEVDEEKAAGFLLGWLMKCADPYDTTEFEKRYPGQVLHPHGLEILIQRFLKPDASTWSRAFHLLRAKRLIDVDVLDGQTYARPAPGLEKRVTLEERPHGSEILPFARLLPEAEKPTDPEPPPRAYSDYEVKVLKALEGKVLTLKDLHLMPAVNCSRSTLTHHKRGVLTKLRNEGKIVHKAGAGYYRPDAPPLEWKDLPK